MKKILLMMFILILFAGLSVGNDSTRKNTNDGFLLSVKQKMEKLGFQIGSIKKTSENKYAVFIKGFSAKVPGLTHPGSLKPFNLNVSVIPKPGNRDKAGLIGDTGILLLNRNILLNQNFILDDNELPRDLGVKIK